MIVALTIKNYALIQGLNMTPSSRLNIITGETGAGKSIMLGALGLLMGNRSDTKVLLNEAEKCVVEGAFNLTGYHLEKLFDELDLDYELESVIRREISPNGKSRAFINDTPVTLNQLKALGQRLMDIHSQHESLQLADNRYQLEVLDAFAAHTDFLTDYQEKYNGYRKALTEYNKLVEKSNQNAEDLDYKQFLFNELSEARLDDLNQEEMEEELRVLENAEEIKLKLSQIEQLMDHSEVAILDQLREIQLLLNSMSSFSKDIESLSDRTESSVLELRDIANEVSGVQDRITHDPERMNELKDQLDRIYNLQTKHRAKGIDELIKLRDELDEALQQVTNIDEQIKELKSRLEEKESTMRAAGDKLSESRKLAALDFAAEIEKVIRQLGIENGSVEIRVMSSEPAATGLDRIDLLFSANKGVSPQEIKEVASGGEFSRLIFAIKYLIAGKTKLPTVIFDEIDTEVSGEIAIQMIHMMKEMAESHQVISISHLPQFAAGGDAHYFVYKDHSSDRSVSKIRLLGEEERVSEIAKMIGGKEPTDAAYSSARELLGIS